MLARYQRHRTASSPAPRAPALPTRSHVAKRCGKEAQKGAASASGSLRSTHVHMSATESSSRPSGSAHSTLPCGWGEVGWGPCGGCGGLSSEVREKLRFTESVSAGVLMGTHGGQVASVRACRCVACSMHQHAGGARKVMLVVLIHSTACCRQVRAIVPCISFNQPPSHGIYAAPPRTHQV